MENEKQGSNNNKKTKWVRIPFDAVSLESNEEKQRYEKPFEFDCVGRKITIIQTRIRSLNSVGLAICLVLAKYFETVQKKSPGFLKGKRCIELGAGCGITGIIATILGAQVLFTDTKRMLEHLNHNILLNLDPKENSFEVKELNWGKTNTKTLSPPFDIVFATDVIYSKKLVRNLLKTAYNLMDNRSIFYLTFEAHEKEAADEFWREVKNFFHVNKISKDLLDEFYRDERIFPLILKKIVKDGENANKEASDYSEISDDSYSDYDSDD